MSTAQPNEHTALQRNSEEEATGKASVFDSFFQPFSARILSLLPARPEPMRAKSKRADRIPDDPQRPLVTDYHSIDDSSIRVRIPKKVLTPVKVEAKVWFANERTFVSYLSMGLLLSTIASGLLFGAKDSPARWFAFAYASISVGILVYGWVIFQRRLTMISSRHSGSFDLLWGPLFICLALFVAISANFIFRLQETRKQTGVDPLSIRNAWHASAAQGS